MSDKATEGRRAARSAGGSHAGGKGAKKLLGAAVAAGKKVREGYSASTARSLYLATVLGLYVVARTRPDAPAVSGWK